MILPIATVLALSSLTALHAEPDKPAPVTLEYTFQGQDSFIYTQISSMSQTQFLFGTLTSTTTTSTSALTRKLAETLDDGNLVVSDQTTLQSFQGTAGEDVFTYDASNPEDAAKQSDARLSPLLAIQDWAVRYIMGPQGEAHGVQNTEELQQLAGKIEDEALREQLKLGYNEEAMTAEFEPTVYLLPDQPVTIGDQWTRSYTMDADPMEFIINQTMTVVSILDWKDGKSVRVNFEGEMDIKLPSDFPAFMKITQKSTKGSFVFNTHLGTVTDYKMEMDIKMAGSPNPSMGEVSVWTTAGNSYELDIE